MALSGSRRSPASALRALAAAAVLALAGPGLAACGDDDPAPVAAEDTEAPPASPLARIALADEFTHSDPLYVKSDTDRIVSRQIYDPLVARVDPPLGTSGARRGPLVPIGTESGDWFFRVRPGARFHDGTPIDFAAVQANVERWLASGVLAEILPEFIAVDSPGVPAGIRFQLTRPVPDLPAILSDPRLGLVAPAAIGASGGGEISGGEGGSGAYEPGFLGQRRAVLVTAPEWWGRGTGLGPGVRELQILAVPAEQRRAGLLADGLIQVSEGLSEDSLASLRSEPLLVSPTENPNGIAASAAVRGLRGTELVQPLSELWLTSLR
jgi:peptide/nickel transport system substrate-binding protein